MSLNSTTIKYAELHERTIRGLNTGWITAGSVGDAKPIVIMMHGFPDTAECWEYQIEALKDRFFIIAPFVRGAGPSAPSASVGRYGPDSVALDVLEILAEVDPSARRPVFLVGHDLGAVHAWHLAGLLQNRVAGLVIINGLTIKQFARRLRHSPRQAAKSWYIYFMQLPVLPEALLGRFGRRFIGVAHKKGGLSHDRRPASDMLTGALVGPMNQYRAFFRALPSVVSGAFKRLKCPVLVVFGENDAFLEPPTREELARDATNLTVRILPGNHWLHREEPDKINRLIKDFFDRCGEPT